MDKILSLNEMINNAKKRNLSFFDYTIQEQALKNELTKDDILQNMHEAILVMEKAIYKGYETKKTRGGLAGGDALKFRKYMKDKKHIGLTGTVLQNTIKYALAVGEANAAMGKIVAAPTAGASGVLPGVLFALKKHLLLTDEKLSEGLFIAGVIGLVIASRATLSGAVGGCQAECGSAAAMAAGAAVYLAGGDSDMIGHASAMALKNMLGLVCDPVAGLVEVPCIKRNAGSAAQALVAADMALVGITSLIPADEVFDAMKSIGNSMPCTLKETSQGGIATTPTGMFWNQKIIDEE